MLIHPREDRPFILDTDASNTGMGAVLSQEINGIERPVAFYSRTLDKCRRNYCVTRRELLAVVWAVEHFRPYLWGQRFLLRTDHASLIWLKSFKEPPGQLARWFEVLAQFDFEMVHRAGAKHGNADGMSRKRPCSEPGPCEKCDKTDAVNARCDNYIVGDPSDHDDGAPIEHAAPWSNPTLRHCKVARVESRKLRQQRRNRDKKVRDSRVATGAAATSRHCGLTRVASRRLQQRKGVFELEIEEDIDAARWKKWQEADPTLKELRRLKMAGDRPPPKSEYSAQSPDFKTYIHDWDRIQVDDRDLLCREWTEWSGPGERVYQQVLVPHAQRELVMDRYHNAVSSGHLGTDKTVGKIRQRFHWRRLNQDVRLHIRTCETCLARQKSKGIKNPLQKYISGAPFERIAMDIMCDLPPTAGTPSYRHILVIGCYFSKWPEAIPLVDMRAETVARALVDHFISKFGVPFEIHSDRGSNFQSELMRDVATRLGMKQTRTAAYHPQSDGMIERSNATIQKMLAAYVNDRQDDWDVYLQVVMMAYRASPHAATGMSPNLIVLGKENVLPVDMEMGIKQRSVDQSPHKYVKGISKIQYYTHELVRKHLNEAFEESARYYNRDATDEHFEVDDIVMFKLAQVKVGRKRKLCPRWEGPFVVRRRLGEVTYVIQRFRHSRPKAVNANRLKTYIGRFPPTWHLTREERKQRKQKSETEESTSGSEDSSSESSDHVATPPPKRRATRKSKSARRQKSTSSSGSEAVVKLPPATSRRSKRNVQRDATPPTLTRATRASRHRKKIASE